MLGRIIRVHDNTIFIKLEINIYDQESLINKYLIFDDNYKIVGEITNIENDILSTSLVGEFNNNDFTYGNVRKPSFGSKCRLATKEELDIIFNIDKTKNTLNLGKSFFYQDYDINLNINNFFSNHFAILGNSGSGKSYAVSRIIQSIFYDAKELPYRPNIILFDAYGEYQQAFTEIGKINENINYKVYTTDLKSTNLEILRIPFWLLGVDDLALLLNATEPTQIPIIEKSLKLVSYFCRNDENVLKQKTDIIARNILDVIFNGKNPSEIRNKLISILSKFYTKDINLDIKLVKGGWSRTIRQCISVEEDGKFADIELVISYLETLISNVFELSFPDGTYKYTIEDFALALEFALISEGVLNSTKVFDYANILKIRLNALINSDYVNYFRFDNYINMHDYIRLLLTSNNGKKVQVLNFNINYVDDRFAKTLVKIYSKMIFNYTTSLEKRASIPFHIILEEAHRYVQNDTDVKVLGYNIFERITKEGRKYGVLLGLISQRPCELSESTISQCTNFLIFKIFHPTDLNYVSSVIPNIDSETINRLKMLYPGICITFGNAFKMPTLVNIAKPNPEPLSQSTDINNIWYIKN